MQNDDFESNIGIWLRRDGVVALDPAGTNIYTPPKDHRGYPYIPENLLTLKDRSKFLTITIIDPITSTLKTVKGFYLHAMIVRTFGDKYGNYKGISVPVGYDIDHINMKHDDPAVWNLEVITHIRNLWRAAVRYPSDDTYARFKNEYANLTEPELLKFEYEKKLDIIKDAIIQLRKEGLL